MAETSMTAVTIKIPDEARATTRKHVIVKKTWFMHLCCKLMSKGTHWFDASLMLIPNQMSQMLLLLPSCLAKLGWWRAILGTAIFGLLSCWTAHIVQVFYFRYYRSKKKHDDDVKNEIIIQWDKLLSRSFHDHGHLKKLGMLGMGFNCLCLLTRSIIQLTYAVSIIYFVMDKIEKRNWTYALAFCCIVFAIVPTFGNYRIFSIFNCLIATVAAVSIALASLLHQPVKGVKHTVASSSVQSLAWVFSTVVYAFGDASASVETLVIIKELDDDNENDKFDNKKYFKYAFWGSTAYTTALSLVAAWSSYRAFGDQLSNILLDAQPCTLALLPPSLLHDIAAISLLILELVAIGYSLYPLFKYIKRVISLLPCKTDSCHFLHFVACASVVGLVCIVAAAIPFSDSMEITSLVGSLIVSPAIYIIPAAAHMLYFGYSRHRDDGRLSGFSLFTLYMINMIQFLGVLIFVTMMGGITSINKVLLMCRFTDGSENRLIPT